ncbi:MAG: cation:proton antiporter [Thermoplasmata archaeon]
MSFLSPSETTVAILLLGATILLAFGSDVLAERFRVPDVLWLILFGLLAGPIFHLVTPGQVEHLGAILGAAALVLILYDAGIDFNIRDLRSVGLAASAVAFASFAASTLALMAVAYLVLAPGQLLPSVLFALSLAGVSGAVVLPVALRLGFPDPWPVMLGLEYAIEDTVAVLSVTILVSVVARGGGLGEVVPAVLLPLPLAIAFGLLGGFVGIQFLSRWQSRTYAGLATMGVLFLVYAAAESLDGSGIMAALIMGIVLGNDAFFRRWLPRSSRRTFAFDPSVRQVHNDIAFVLRALFLVILGILVPFQPLGWIAVGAVVGLPIVLLIVRRALLRAAANSGRIPSGLVGRFAGLYARGLTNAVVLILAIDLLPVASSAALQNLLLPAFVIIVGTNIAMTVLVAIGPGPAAPPAGPSGRPVTPYARMLLEPIPPRSPAAEETPAPTSMGPRAPPGTAAGRRRTSTDG